MQRVQVAHPIPHPNERNGKCFYLLANCFHMDSFRKLAVGICDSYHVILDMLNPFAECREKGVNGVMMGLVILILADTAS